MGHRNYEKETKLLHKADKLGLFHFITKEESLFLHECIAYAVQYYYLMSSGYQPSFYLPEEQIKTINLKDVVLFSSSKYCKTVELIGKYLASKYKDDEYFWDKLRKIASLKKLKRLF